MMLFREMRKIETATLEIKVYDDDLVRARRKDRKPLTDEDRAKARRLADSHPPEITVADVCSPFSLAAG
jgi:hypothetical protein